MKKKILAVVLAVVILAVAAIGATLAWLMDKTDAVVNTFTVGNVDITLTETKGGEEKMFKMVPGALVDKDPKVTVTAGSEDCYVFVKLVEDNGDLPDGDDPDTTDVVETAVDVLEVTIADGWTELTKGSGIYYREVSGDAAKGVAYSVLANDKIKISDDLTKDHMDALTPVDNGEGGQTDPVEPTLTITAYAIQKANLAAPAEYEGTIYQYAWEQVSGVGA